MKLIYYTLFALFSIAVNLGTQALSFALYSGRFDIYVAMFFGTLLGLVVKYILDKRYIFEHKTQTHKENGVKFLLYSFMGVFTTIIFWSTEFLFYTIFQTQEFAYIGGFIGLVIGYVVKYNLDKKFVFRESKR